MFISKKLRIDLQNLIRGTAQIQLQAEYAPSFGEI